MATTNKGKNPPPDACPYCGEDIGRLPAHLPCDETPDTPAGRDA